MCVCVCVCVCVLCCSQKSGTNENSGNFFDSVDDFSNEQDQGVETAEQTVDCAVPQSRLPNPLSDWTPNTEDDDERQTSVFTNYFHKAEEAKLAILEHHVKLTEQPKADDKQTKKRNRKGVCISFQRGRCRFGTKCRFAHSISSEANETGTDISSEVSASASKFGLLPSALMPLSVEAEDDEDMQKKRKQRSGVTDSLVPPKRAMKSLEQQRKHERPWTVTPQ